jgi:multimeric flavodoxin WrbA
MKIVAVNASPKTSGHTGQVLAVLMDAAKAAGAAIEIFSLGKQVVKPCTGCLACQKTGRCVLQDDYESIKAALIDADGIVFATPNYMYGVSAQMKALLDRSFSMCHCQTLANKYGAVLITSGGPFFERTEDYLLHIVGCMGCWNVGSLAVLESQVADPEKRPETMQAAAELGGRLARAIAEKQSFPEQQEGRTMYFEAMRWLVESQKELWPYEYEYWQMHWPAE